MKLFNKNQFAGVFRGFTHGGLEFHADIVLPYQADFQRSPMHGQFVLVQLETTTEAVLGRITSLSADGRLSSSSGEDYSIRVARKGTGGISADLKDTFLKYRVNIRVLGIVQIDNDNKLQFVASHRRLPHLGSEVAFPSPEVLKALVSKGDGALIGHLAYGEFVYLGAKADPPEPGMRPLDPVAPVHFDINHLISRRTFIFARAGFGKSNLNKLLFSELYRTDPVTPKMERLAPVGTVIFDPEGEYFWPDDRGRPGLCDVAHLRERLVVFTPRRSESAYYQSFVAAGIKLDIRRLRPADVIAIALGSERQDQQNVSKLRSLGVERWQALVDLIYRHGNQSSLDTISDLLNLDPVREDVQAMAARANMTTIVRALHDPGSQFLDMLLAALSAGKLCVVDISQMRGTQSLMLTGLILKRIFDKNQEEFTKYPSMTIPVIAVVEEAQTVLGKSNTSTDPYISWVKEGRKYDLGALLITQQPGSIPMEILSQGDNWFVFHMLAASDLSSIGQANAHFSEDLRSSLLNEPIPGQGVFWSSANRRSYPLSVRICSFDALYKAIDPKRDQPAVETYAGQLREFFGRLAPENADPKNLPEVGVRELRPDDYGELQNVHVPIPSADESNEESPPEGPDFKARYEAKAIAAFRDSEPASQLHDGKDIAWGTIKATLKDFLPPELDDRDAFAFQMVRRAMDRVFGLQGQGWHSFRDDRGITKVKKGLEA